MDEESPSLFSSAEKPRISIGVRVVIGLFVVALLAGGVWFLTRPHNNPNPSPEPPAPTEEEVKAQRELKERDDRVAIYKPLIDTTYPGWTLFGDDIDSLDFLLEKDVVVKVHLRKDGKDRVVTVILHKFRLTTGQPQKDDEYWIAYKPTVLELGQLELNTIRKTEFKNGQENPPEPDYDPEP